jgi:hypothetical protein
MNKPTKFHTHKSVDYSYPTSPNAERFGFSKSGCYTISLNDPTGVRTPVAVSAYSTLDEALKAVGQMPQPEYEILMMFYRK